MRTAEGDRGQSMSRRRVVVLLGGMASALAVMPAQASAGVYTVANCAADPSRYATEAFNVFATRGMGITKACHPQGKGRAGSSWATRSGAGAPSSAASYAQISIDAPAGTQFVEYRWAGEPRRTDCRYAIQMWGEAPARSPYRSSTYAPTRSAHAPTARSSSRSPQKAYSVPVRRASCIAWCASAAAGAIVLDVGLQPDPDLSRRGDVEDTTPPVVRRGSTRR